MSLSPMIRLTGKRPASAAGRTCSMMILGYDRAGARAVRAALASTVMVFNLIVRPFTCTPREVGAGCRPSHGLLVTGLPAGAAPLAIDICEASIGERPSHDAHVPDRRCAGA